VELRARARQQEAIAGLGQRALAGMPLDQLLEDAAATAGGVLGTEYVTVLELTGDERGLLVRAGHGLPEGVVGGVLPADQDDLLGYALRADGPIVIDDFAKETRVRPSPVQTDLGVVSAMAAPIGALGRHFGVLGAHSLTARHFSADDAYFLQALANVLGAAAERMRHEDVVRDSEGRFRELADTAPALMWMTDAEGHVTFVNEGWLRFTGNPNEQELGESFGRSAHPDDRPALLAHWRECFARREEFRFEYRLIRHDGSYRWVLEAGTPRFAGGEFVGYVGTATDIHERRAMEEALRESEASFRKLADTAPVMMWTADEQGMVTFVNAGWLRFTGRTLEEEVGDTMTLGVHPDYAAEMQASWNDAVAKRMPWEAEYQLLDRWGEYRWIVDRGVPRYEGGRFVGHVGTAIDIHSRKLMEARLEEAYQAEHRIAETLQRSLLPERLPEVDGLELAARYLPAVRGAAIGGDWYDALERSDGRVALVVGDVVGHGLRAAATMGQLRNAFRAYGLVEESPATVMASINRLVLSGPETPMATVLYILLDRETGEIAFTSAGHPPPLVLTPDGPRFLEDGRSVPVGASDPSAFREAQEVLPPGSTLVLYTDGLVERRGVPLERRLDELARAASAAESDLERLCDAILDRLLAGEEPEDDVALLVVRPQPVDAERIAVSLAAEPESLAVLRRGLGRFLHAAGASDAETFETTLSICEAAGNAIEHAYGPVDARFHVDVAMEDGEVVAAVRDEGAWRVRRGRHRGRGLKIIGELMDDVDIANEEAGTVVTMRRRLAAAQSP
jgi:PAS domain S-box-containing protein